MKDVTEIVGTGDIAKEFGVSRSAPGVWERRGRRGQSPDPFPERLTTINRGRGKSGGVGIWNRRDVENWGRRTGRLKLQKGHIYDAVTGEDVTRRNR